MSVETVNASKNSTSHVHIYDAATARKGILKRRHIESAELPPHIQDRVDTLFGEPTTAEAAVRAILCSVRERGDAAVADWSNRIDGVDISKSAEVPQSQLLAALSRVNPGVVDGLRCACARIIKYHKNQPVSSWFTTELGGITGQAVVPIERVGVYVPGGTAPLPSTVLMSALPAYVAGSSKLIIMSPPQRETGSIADVTLAACAVVSELDSIDVRVFAVGGAQAIGALAYGTETIPQVDKIVGPGNIFVTLAKKQVFGMVGIDGVYGPTEAVVIADEAADTRLVAADLLAQAEHDFMAVPILITYSAKVAKGVSLELERQLICLPRAEVARHSLLKQGGIVLASTLEECYELASDFATEHVSLSVKSPWDGLSKIKNAGGVFMGEGSCEVLGDYIAGPSHVMPTGGSARFSSPLSVLDFIKVISVVGLDAETVRKIAPLAERVARAEGLDGHAAAAAMRKEFDG